MPERERFLGCRTLATATALALGIPRTRAISLDVTLSSLLEAEVAAHDLVISLVPFVYHTAVIGAAIVGKTNVVTTSYVSPAMRELEPAIKGAGITVLNEVGVDPGVDHLYAIKTINEVHEKGGKVGPHLRLLIYHAFAESLIFRLRDSIHSVGASQHQNTPITLFASSFPGLHVALFFPSKTRRHIFKTGKL